MNSSIKAEIDYCRAELYSISRELESVARDVNSSIQGMSTSRYIRTLEYCASKYRSAADQLGKIQ